MRIQAVVYLLACCFAVGTVSAQTSKEAKTGVKVSGAGCTRHGVEAGCMVLTDSKTKTKYNLFFGDATKPDFDIAISFTGVTKGGVNVCMEGKPVDVTKWTPIRMHCPPEEKKPQKEGKKK